MIYKIELSRAAANQLELIPKKDLKKIARRIEKLSEDPFPEGTQKLQGGENIYRIRQGDYRILYTVLEQKLLIMVVKIGHRREMYR